MYLQQNSWIFGSETGGDLFLLEITPAKGFPNHDLFGCRKSNYFAGSHQFYRKKRSQPEFERSVFDQLLLIALIVTHHEARSPAVTPQRSGFGPQSAS